MLRPGEKPSLVVLRPAESYGQCYTWGGLIQLFK